MAKVDEALDLIKGMTILEVSDLVKRLETEFGVTAAAPMMAAVPAAAAAGPATAAPVEEKTEFNVVLKEIGPNKINVIKVVREITALGLKEAKDLVEAAPKLIREGVPKDEANNIKGKLEAVGAVVEVQ